MKTLIVSLVSLIFSLIGIPSVAAQAPDLGTIANFALFTSGGALGNTAVSHINGDIGTHVGAITGFALPTVVNGSIESANSITLQASIDLQAAYTQLFNTVATDSSHTPAFGSLTGETLNAGVYSIAAAGSLGGILILDAQGDSNAVFIFKFGGAFTTGAVSTVILINGAQASNVYWIAEGMIAMAAGTSMQGTMIANNGAISIGDGGALVGRMLSTLGAVSIYGSRISLTPFPFLDDGETPDLGTVADFAIFTSGGAIDNTATSNITGDIGTEVGAVTGFGPPTIVNGSIEISNLVTAQATVDLDAAYVQLYFTPPTVTDHVAVFGGGETLTAGVYSRADAGSVNGTLILNGEGNQNAVFIFKFGGALTTAAGATVSLINGASACNVFWVSEGATSMAANTTMKGTMIAHNGAISMGVGGDLKGRMLSTLGAASVYQDYISIPYCGAAALPITSFAFTGACNDDQVILKWNTASEINNGYFTIERSREGLNWIVIGTQPGKGNSSDIQHYAFTDKNPDFQISRYRLKQTDINGSFRYIHEVIVNRCNEGSGSRSAIYPNPSSGKFVVSISGNPDEVISTEIYNAKGQKIYRVDGFQSEFDLSHKPAGLYFMKVNMDSKTIKLKFILSQ